MGVIPLGERPSPSTPPRGLAPFALGFRPFFSLAGIAGLVLIPLWLVLWHSGSPIAHYGNIGWHSHEMLFGFTVAVISGFLLTAVRNWTGTDTLSGTPLAMLALLWLLARIVPFVPGMPPIGIALTDLAYLPLLAVALYAPLMGAENRINRIFLPLLGLMTLANLLVHLDHLGLTHTGQRGINLMVDLIMLLLIMVSGRVVPFFAEKAVAGAKPRFDARRERFAFVTIGIWTLLDLFLPLPWLLAPAALGVAAAQLWRLYDWHHPGIWRLPILWVLYTGMAWLALGFLLKSLAAAGVFPANLATHALTAGAIGTLVFGMMARVALGHTGREITPARPIAYAFILLNLAALSRVFGPLLPVGSYIYWVMFSGAGWALCYLLFDIYYLRLLNTPRIDGRPG
ncbi:MAG: NnrS family protein [Candidatus Thiodiazotropha sp.]